MSPLGVQGVPDVTISSTWIFQDVRTVEAGVEILPEAFIFPFTSSFAVGVEVQIPTFHPAVL